MSDLRPMEGEVFTDAEGRKLEVQRVVVGHRDGREVQGQLYKRSSMTDEGTLYSCTLQTWVDVWRDKAPRHRNEQ